MSRIFAMKQLCGEAFWVVAGQLLSALALLVGMRILTELVDPQVFGEVALFNGLVALGVAVLSYPYISAGMRFTPECRSAAERRALYDRVHVFALRAVALASVSLLLGGYLYCREYDGSWLPYLLTAVLLMVVVRRELGVQLLAGGRRQRSASLWLACDSLLRPVFAIALVNAFGAAPEWVLLGYILAGIAANSCGSLLRRGDQPPAEAYGKATARQFGRKIWIYALPLIPMELIFWLNGLGDRYLIGYLLSAADVGLYAATYLLVNEAFNRSAMVLLRFFQPLYFQLCSSRQWLLARKLLWLWVGCVLFLGLGGVLLLQSGKDWLAGLLLAGSYRASAELMPAIAGGCALHALGTVLAQPLLAGKRTRLLLLGRFCGVVAAAAAIPLLVTEYGLAGAALANPVYFGVEALVLALLAKPWRKFPATGRAVRRTPARRYTLAA